MFSLLKKRISLLILFIVSAGSFSYAQNTNDAIRVGFPGLGSNARALGMGNAYVGLSDDASAAYFNPAGLGFLKRLEFSGGLSYQNTGNTTTFLGNTSEYSNSSTRLDRLSFALPFPTMRGSLVFGLSYHNTTDLTDALEFEGFNQSSSFISDLNSYSLIPYELYLTDADTTTNLNNRLEQSGNRLNSGSINNWTLTGAVEVQKNIMIGVNLNIISGSYSSDFDFYETDIMGIYQDPTTPGDATTADFQRFYLNRIIDWDISGWDAKVGIMYQLNQYARFGASVQFPKQYTIKEKFTSNAEAEFATKTNTYEFTEEVEYDITTPFALAAGFSVNFKGLIASAEATLTDYSQMEFSNEENISRQLISSANKDIKDLFKAVVNLNGGVEYTIPAIGLRLRGGFILQPSAYKDDPSTFDRKYVTGGIGFLTDGTIGIDLGYAHGWWETYGDNYGNDVSRTFQDISYDKLAMTVTYRF